MEDGMGASTVGDRKQEQTSPAKSFAEEALRLSGKSEEEVRRAGDVDKADEQVESMFASQYQTANSPVHRAVWDWHIPMELFAPTALPAQANCDAAMSRCLEIVRRRRLGNNLIDHK